MIEIENVIILLLSIFIIILLMSKKNENFELLDTNTKWMVEGYKLIPFPNFYEVFGSNDLSKTFEFPGNNNWKLFTNTNLLEKEGLASLISTTNPPFYNFDENIRLTGFSNTTAVIGLMTPNKILPSGQWLKGFSWQGVSRLGEDKNAKDVIVWANHKKSTDIKLNNQNLIEDAIQLLQFQVPKDANLAGPKYYSIPNYQRNNNPPFTTYYFQIFSNWGNTDTVKVGAIIPYFDI